MILANVDLQFQKINFHSKNVTNNNFIIHTSRYFNGYTSDRIQVNDAYAEFINLNNSSYATIIFHQKLRLKCLAK